MTTLEPPRDLQPKDKLLLNAGQLDYPGKASRAVALALAAWVDHAGEKGAEGNGYLPDGPTLSGTAEGLITLDTPLTHPMLLHQLDVLITARYLSVAALEPGASYTVNTCSLPLRAMTPMDCAEDIEQLQAESDIYGYGDQ